MRIERLQRVAEEVERIAPGACRLALAALALTAAAPAAAQSDMAWGTGEILEPILVVNEADMDFGDIIPRGTDGTVVMTPSATAACTANNGLVHGGACRAATFDGEVTVLFVLRITKPLGNQITLSGPGGATMRLDDFTFGAGSPMLDLGSTATEQRYLILDVNGSFTVHVGGTLHVGGMQAPGVYDGVFILQFNYD